jgi:D-aminopeptidase
MTSDIDVPQARPRARDVGIAPGILPPGPLNAITDVQGVRVGHYTLSRGSDIRTGVTAILPHGGNLLQDKVPGAVFIGNAFGKLAGSTQVQELGEIETPIILTNTLGVAAGMEGVIRWNMVQPGNEKGGSINALVGETNDGGLSDIRALAITAEMVMEAISSATDGPVAEGSVGAGHGTTCFGWKGGIGTSSRRTGDHTVGVLVQTNYDGALEILGVPVGRELRQAGFEPDGPNEVGGSVMIVVATDAPLNPRTLERLALRAILALGRTGSVMSNGSGDYVLAFSTAESVRRTPARRTGVADVQDLANARMNGLFRATVEATEEAIYNSLLQATTITGRSTRRALPVGPTLEILRRHNRLEAGGR